MGIEKETTANDTASAAYKEFQDSISLATAKYMAGEGIGLLEFAKRLGGDSRLAFRLLRGSGKLRLSDLIELGNLNQKKVRIFFE